MATGRWIGKARVLRLETAALIVAVRDPRTPRRARWLGLLVVAYALSPIDLVPDVIPVLGLLDELVLLPIGIMLVRRMVPEQVLVEAREHPATRAVRIGLWGAAIVVAVWVVLLVALAVTWVRAR
jgi:uncharacterized membrane protein YkvA (DUF1232 family)